MQLRFLLKLTFLALPGSLIAQDGGQLYAAYCSACHGEDGKGTGGQFPPLAASPWVEGDAARATKIILHGLHGKIDVDGRQFDLDMPPQGAVLDDAKIAAILSYVRASWGNKEDAVSADFVKSTRSATEGRKGPWTAAELLKLHPLAAAKPPIDNLISQVYLGEWKDLPDFSQLQATNGEEEHAGLISLAKSGHKDTFAMVWQGDITAPKEGAYVFRLDADDGGRVLIDGKEIARVGGIGPMNGSRLKEGKVQLTAGVHKIRVEYYEYKGNEGIALAWSGPGLNGWRNLSDNAPKTFEKPLMIKASKERAVVYRNFISGSSARGIGVGFPGGVNLVYSADRLAPELIWTGDFISGGRHWTDRGQGYEPPAGTNVVRLSQASALPNDAHFRGYRLDKSGNPTFSVQAGAALLTDSWEPVVSASSAGFTRTLSTAGGNGDLEILLANQAPVSEQPDGKFLIGDAVLLSTENAIAELRNGQLFIKIPNGKKVVVTYLWK